MHAFSPTPSSPTTAAASKPASASKPKAAATPKASASRAARPPSVAEGIDINAFVSMATAMEVRAYLSILSKLSRVLLVLS